MLKRLKYIFVIATYLCACNAKDDNSGEKKLRSNSSAVDSKPTHANEDFESFFKKFDSDSVFQKSRIQFPLKYIVYGDEGDQDSIKYIQERSINHIGLNKLKEANMIQKKKTLGLTKVEIQFLIEDTGYEKNFLFMKTNNKWFLVSVKDLSD